VQYEKIYYTMAYCYFSTTPHLSVVMSDYPVSIGFWYITWTTKMLLDISKCLFNCETTCICL